MRVRACSSGILNVFKLAEMAPKKSKLHQVDLWCTQTILGHIHNHLCAYVDIKITLELFLGSAHLFAPKFDILYLSKRLVCVFNITNTRSEKLHPWNYIIALGSSGLTEFHQV